MSDDLEDDDDPKDGPKEGEEPDGEEAEKGGGKKKLILIIAVAVFLIAGGVMAAFFMGFLDPLLGIEDEAKVEAPPPLLPTIYYDLPEIMVDLKSNGRRTRYIKVTVIAEISKTFEPRIGELKIKIKDRFQSWLRQQTREGLSGTAGTEMMRAGLLVVLNKILAPDYAKSILFKEILLQ